VLECYRGWRCGSIPDLDWPVLPEEGVAQDLKRYWPYSRDVGAFDRANDGLADHLIDR